MNKAQTPLRIALVTSGIDHLSATFHSWPEKPAMIVELNEWSVKQKAKYFVRKILRLVFRSKYPDCEAYCRKHKLQYARVRKSNKAQLGSVLSKRDISLVVSYRCAIIPMDALASVPHGGINLHGSLLPNYRGGNPLFWQVLYDEENAGCTVHKLSPGIDEGDILDQVAIKRPRFIHHEDLNHKVNVELGQPLLVKVIQAVAKGETVSTLQSTSNDSDQVLRAAPNCDWSTWQSVFPLDELTEEHKRDILSFLGQEASSAIKPLII